MTHPHDPDSRPRILVLRLSALGDVILAMTAVATLRRAMPHAHITWLVEDRFQGLLHGLADIDEVLVFPRNRWRGRAKRIGTLFPTIGEAAVFLRDLRRRRFDLTLDFQGNLKSAVFNFAARSPRRVGFVRGASREMNHLANNEHVTPPPDTRHRLHKDLSLVAGFEGVGASVAPTFRLRSEDETVARDFLEEVGLAGRPFAVLHPGTSKFGDFKRWPTGKYAELAAKLREVHGLETVATWGPGEEDLAREVATVEGVHVAPRTGSLLELLALLREARLYVGADTGVTHLAAALQIPTVALFGPKDPEIYAPLGPHVNVVTHDIDCRPCGLRKCPYGHVKCMKDLEVAAVTRAASAVLAG